MNLNLSRIQRLAAAVTVAGAVALLTAKPVAAFDDYRACTCEEFEQARQDANAGCYQPGGGQYAPYPNWIPFYCGYVPEWECQYNLTTETVEYPMDCYEMPEPVNYCAGVNPC